MLHLNNVVKASHTTSASDVIKETMDYYHVTQVDLASRLNVSQKYISSILSRKSFITPEMALKIEHVMGISSKLLLNLDLSYKLHAAKEHLKFQIKNNHSPIFLKKYSWVR